MASEILCQLEKVEGLPVLRLENLDLFTVIALSHAVADALGSGAYGNAQICGSTLVKISIAQQDDGRPVMLWPR